MFKRLYPNYKRSLSYYAMEIDKILSPSNVKKYMKEQDMDESEYKDDLTGENLV